MALRLAAWECRAARGDVSVYLAAAAMPERPDGVPRVQLRGHDAPIPRLGATPSSFSSVPG
eukprot:6183059-Pleurochrysis_carterae.AAC.2